MLQGFSLLRIVTQCWGKLLIATSTYLQLQWLYCVQYLEVYKYGMYVFQVLYVSSLSFASITTTEDSIKSRQDTEMQRMTENLQLAREKSFRYNTDKYWDTMRIFHKGRSQV